MLIEEFPTDSCDTYVEPFMGAGNIILRMKKGLFTREVINDLDPRMHQLMNDVRLVDIKDIDAMDFTPTKSKWAWCQSNGINLPASTERFHSNIYTVWFSFSGMATCYSNRARSIANFKRKLPRIQQRLRDVEVCNEDAFDVVRRHMDDPAAFIFLDPPYLDTCCKAYSNQTIDVVGLRDLLASAKCKWMVTYNDHPDLVDLYGDFHIARHEVLYIIGGRRRTKPEIIITNYQTNL